MSYWEAKGPALQTYKQLIPRIRDTLNEKQGPLPNSDFIWFGLYMVGPDMENAMPHIMFTGENKTARKQAMKIIKGSGILSEYPGMHVGHWTEPPHIGNQALRVGPAPPEALDSRYLAAVPNKIESERFFIGTRESTVINFHFEHGTVYATSGLGWEFEDWIYWLTVAHVLFEPGSQGDTDSGESDSSSSEYDFEGFTGHEAYGDSNPMGTSAGSLSTSASGGSDDRGSEYSVSSSPRDHHQSLGVMISDMAADSPTLSTLMISGSNPSGVPVRSSLPNIQGNLDDCLVISAQLDYCLYASPFRAKNESSTESARTHDVTPAQSLQILTPGIIIQPTQQGNKAQVHTSRGTLSGIIKKEGMHVLLPGSSGYQEIYTAYLESPVLAGDSGAIVSNTTGQIYGHVVSGSSASVAFVVPLSQVYKDIYLRSQGMYDFGWAADLRTLQGHTGQIRSAAISPDHQFIASASDDNTVRIWDLKTGNVRRILRGHKDRLYLVAISPDSQFVASASFDQTVRIWDIKTGTQQRVFVDNTTLFFSVAISPGGHFVVLAPFNRVLRLWDVKKGIEKKVFKGLEGRENDVMVSPNSQFVVSASDSTTIQIWDVESGLQQWALKGHQDLVGPTAMTSDSHFVVSASSDGTIRIWDIGNGTVQRVLQGHGDCVRMVAISPDGEYVISASDDETVRIWDFTTGTEQRRLEGFGNGVGSVAISSKGEFVIATLDKNTVRVWDERVETGT